MIPSALICSRYRAFKEEIHIHLAPLTIIIGKNGGGKSVISRLPLLLSGGLSETADSPLDLQAGEISHATRFEDLVHQRSAQPFVLGAEISDGRSKMMFKTTLRHIVEHHDIGLEAFNWYVDDQIQLTMRAATPEDILNRSGTYTISIPGKDEFNVTETDTTGIFPLYLDDLDKLSLRAFRARGYFAKAFASPAYLGPFRSIQSSTGRAPRQRSKTLGPGGERALDMLGNDALRGDGSLVDAVSSWFRDAMEGARVTPDLIGGIPRLLVADPHRAIDVDLLETGAGFAQVLPIVVQIQAIRLGQLQNTMSIIEQPELHLHPAAHGPVADLILDGAVYCKGATIHVCETHSEQFVTRVRRRIAEGRIDSSDVIILSVGHRDEENGEIDPIREIRFDKYGNPDSWPVGVFDEAFDDLLHLRQAAERLDEIDRNKKL
jgi:predicted ATPase